MGVGKVGCTNGLEALPLMDSGELIVNSPPNTDRPMRRWTDSRSRETPRSECDDLVGSMMVCLLSHIREG